MTDPIADMLTRIRNMIVAKHSEVSIPHSKVKQEIARVLKEEGYIENFESVGDGAQKTIKVYLKNFEDGMPVISEIKRISKPSRRVYVDKTNVPRISDGMGISVLSTSKGIMTGTNARKIGVGGEIICTVV